MRDLNRELRRSGRGPGQYSRRLRSGYLSHLQDLWSQDHGTVHQPTYRKGKEGAVRAPREKLNWRVQSEGGEVIAVEPDLKHEHVFEGGADPFQEALEYAAKQLREGQS